MSNTPTQQTQCITIHLTYCYFCLLLRLLKFFLTNYAKTMTYTPYLNVTEYQIDLFADTCWDNLRFIQRELLAEQLNLLHPDANFRATTDIFTDLPAWYQAAVISYFELTHPPIKFVFHGRR